MMKRIIALLLLAVWMVNYSWADNLIVDDVTLELYQSEIKINYQFDVENQYSGYQMVLELPDGITTLKDDDGAPLFTKGDCYDESYTLSSNYLDGTDRFVALSLSSKPMTGTEGLLLSIPVVCDEDLEVGTVLQATLRGISFGKTDGLTTVNMPDVTFSITVGNPWITLDENSETLPSATGEVVDILVKRTIPANRWNTICLPFAMSEEQVKEVFGEDVELAEFIEYEVTEENGEVTKINVIFDSALLGEKGFMANYPYIIKTRKDISEFMVSSTIEPDEENAYAEYNNGRGGSRKEVYGTFYGTLRAGKRLEANQLFLNQGNLWYSSGNNTIKAFRGYFDFVDVLSSNEPASNVRIIIDGNTTGIEAITGFVKNNIWYDLQGRQVRTTNSGIYINNGKKNVMK
jgi:hypothetical protein